MGAKIYGNGFTFDDTDHDGVASPLADMERLIAKDPRNAERIFPYIGGEEVNDSPRHVHHRYVINFGEMSEEQARHWPDLMSILEKQVKPERMKLADNASAKPRKENWWLWGRYTPGLFTAIRALERVLVCSRHQPHWCISFMVPNCVFSEALIVFALPNDAAFCTLQSRVHEIWARFFGSSLEDRLRYTPSDCFETFPFPEGVLEPLPHGRGSALECAGKEYYEFRAALMVQNNEGLTKTYNRFHDPNERSSDIARLRQLHAAMDHAVLGAYGWTDLQPTCDFLLDYEEDDDEENPGGRQRKKPWRYRWPDDCRDEVLARLLELNKKRTEQEALAGAETRKPRARKSRKAIAEVNFFQTPTPLQLQLAEAILCITLLLSMWSRRGVQRIRRDVLDAALVLMLNADIRQQLLGQSTPKGSKSANSAERRFVPGLEIILKQLQLNDVVCISDVEGLPMVQLGSKAVLLEKFNAADRSRADETIQIISKQGEQSVQTFLEENVHDTYELVS